MTNIEMRAKEMLKGMTIKSLLDQWELTSVIINKDIPTVRGWLMDEIENRYPNEFDAWLSTDPCNDEDLRKFILK